MRNQENLFHLRILNCFAFCAVPLACWQQWIFPFLPSYHLQHAFVYLAGLFMLWAWHARLWSLADAQELLRKAAPWLALLFALQTAACWHSALRYPVTGQTTAITVAFALAKLAAQIPFLFFFTLLCSVLTANAASRRCLLAGALTAFCILAAICGVQALAIYAWASPISWLHEFAVRALALNNALAPLLEARWKDAVYDFYHAGSYTATLLRMNGVFEEASTLATWVGCFFLPIALGMIVTASHWRYGGWLMFAICIAILFASSALTGLVLGIAGLALIAFHIIRHWKRVSAVLCCLALLTSVACVAWFNPSVQTKLPQVASLPRFVVSLASLKVAGQHPVIGVGRGYFSAHVADEDIYKDASPHQTELHEWKMRGTVPHLSTLPAAIAEYGIPFVLVTLCGFPLIFRQLRAMLRRNPSSVLRRFSVAACGCWLFMSFVAAFADLEMRNALFLLPLGCFHAVSNLKGDSDSA